MCISGECKGTNLCEDVVCGDIECRHPGVCNFTTGLCEYELLPFGQPCNDDDFRTVNETCLEDGTCAGINLCERVICEPIGACFAAGECDFTTGQCSTPYLTPGSHCNVLNISGTCQNGTCISIVGAPSECFDDVVCQNGRCPEHPVLIGSSCDDGIPSTDFEVCQTDGSCSGVDLCVVKNVTCQALSQCHQAGDCFRGNCTNPLLPEGTACDDGDPTTDNDACRC